MPLYYPKKLLSGSWGTGKESAGVLVPHASHRIALFLVPVEPDRALSAEQERQCFDELIRLGWISEGAQLGPAANAVVEGGFQRFRVDRPQRPVLYGNRLGGFRAACPNCGASVAANLGEVIEQWRTEGDRDSACLSCGHRCSLEGWNFSPRAAPGRWALVFSQVGSVSLAPEAREKLEALVGCALHEVVSRG